jgi:hypothetical protein
MDPDIMSGSRGEPVYRPSSISTVVESPGRSRARFGWPGSNTTRTGTRWTILVKLPARLERQQGELGSRCRREALDMAGQRLAAQRIDVHRGLLADEHARASASP